MVIQVTTSMGPPSAVPQRRRQISTAAIDRTVVSNEFIVFFVAFCLCCLKIERAATMD